MQNRTNYHSHCSFCDGKAPMEAFVQAAIQAGFSAYGISSHAPLPFAPAWALKTEQLTDYLTQARRLQAAYADQLEFYVGLEIDALDAEHHPENAYFQSLPLDFRIGSVHLLHNAHGDVVDLDGAPDNFCKKLQLFFEDDLPAVVKGYFAKTRRMIASGGIDFVGHLAKIASNAEAHTPGITQEKWYQREMAETLALLSDTHTRVEINTKAFGTMGLFFPDECYFTELLRHELSVVVNSDAHLPERINAGREEALRALWKAGYRTVSELHAGRWSEVAIAR